MNISTSFKNVLALGLSTYLVLVSGSVFAQLEEIVVTAERKETKLQETAIAVTAMSAGDLERMQISSAEDIDIAVPGMRIDTNVASSTALNVTLRGTAEGNAAFAISESTVGLYQNGVYRRMSAGNIELADVERIEVLRGPQGTLFGRNTLAGAINIVTRVPGQETFGEISASYDNFDTIAVKGLIGGGITDNLAGSLSVLYKDRATGPYTNQFDGEKLGEDNFKGFQGTLNWDLNEDINVQLMVYSTSHSNDGSFGSPVDVSTGELLFDLPDVFVAPPVGQPDVRSSAGADVDGIDVTTSWTISDSLTFKSISHYSTTDTDWAIDFTGGGVASGLCAGLTCTSGFFRTSDAEQDQFSQEFQLLGSTEKLDWLVGLYYYEEDTNQLIQDVLFFGPAAPDNSFLKAENSAIFGQVTYNVSDQLSLTVGARQTEDDKELVGNKANNFFAPQDFSSSPSVSEFTGKLGVDYQLNENILVYASFSQGFKSGAFDSFASADEIGFALEPELVDSIEFGFKGDLLDDTLRLNVALFESDYTDLVVTVIDGSGLQSDNIGEAAITGTEIEATWLATDSLSLFLSITKLFDNGWDETGGVLVSGITEGDDVPSVSELQWTLGASYEWSLGDAGNLTLNGTAKFDDSYFAQAAHQNRALEQVDDRMVFNAGLVFNSSDDKHRVWLNGLNITDEQDFYTLLNFSTFLFNNTALYFPTEPASWELGYKFTF